MNAQGKKWIVRNLEGHIYGPFDLAKMRDLLSRGVFSGEEDIALYPVGDWMPLSGDPELYEVVLSLLQNPNTKIKKSSEGTFGSVAQKTQKPGYQKTRSRAMGSPKEPEPSFDEETSNPKEEDIPEIVTRVMISTKQGVDTEVSEKTRLFKGEKAPPKPLARGPGTEDILMLEEAKKKKGSPLFPLALIAAALVLLYLAFSPQMQLPISKSTLNLLGPNRGGAQDPQQSQKFLQEGWAYFYRDSVENYIKAEENFVASAEKNSGNSDAFTMLMMTYLELWPHAKQDSKDQAVVQEVSKQALRADPYGVKGPIIKASLDLILSQDDNTLASIDQGIASQPAEGRLYFLKGVYFQKRNDFKSAVLYFDRAAALMPSWARPFFLAGFCYEKLGDTAQAQRYFAGALKIYNKHPAALIELGVLEVTAANQLEKAKEYLTAGLFGGEKLAPGVESRGLYYLALTEARRGDKKSALAQAEKALKLDPLNAEIRSLLQQLGKQGDIAGIIGDDRQSMALGEEYLRMSNYLGAQARFKAAFEANPQNARAAMKAAEALWALKQSDEAISFLKKAIQADPKYLDSYILLSQYLSDRFDFSGASQIIEQAVRISPQSSLVARGYAEIYFKRGDIKNAEGAAIRAVRLYETDAQTNELLARIYVQKADSVKALQYAKRAVEIDPTNSKVQATFAKLKAQYYSPKEGLTYLRSLIEAHPAQLPLRLAMAEILIRDDQPQAAQVVLQQILQVDENNRDAHTLMGEASLAANNYSEALRSFASATRVDPSDAQALVKAGDVHMKAGQFTEALKKYQLALKINPRTPRLHYVLSRAYFSAGDGDSALKELEEEKKSNPAGYEAYEFAGDITMRQRKFQKAVTEYRRAAETKPPGAEIYVKLAKAYRGMGSLDNARAMLKIAEGKESGYAEIYREQGFIFEIQGQAAEAVFSFQRYLQLSPSAPDREFIMGKITELQ